MILYENTYEREGNDSWLIDIITIERNQLGLRLNRQYKYTGWLVDDSGSHSIELDEDKSIPDLQLQIDAYLTEFSLNHIYPNGSADGVFIDLHEILS